MSQPYYRQQFVANVFNSSSSCSNELTAFKWPAAENLFWENSLDTNPICNQPLKILVRYLNRGFFLIPLSEHLKGM